MNLEVLKIVIEGIVMIIVGVAAKVVLPYLKEKQQSDLITKAVRAAEKIYCEAGSGVQKKEFVINFLLSKGILKCDELGRIPTEIDIFIEAAVKELDNLIITKSES